MLSFWHEIECSSKNSIYQHQSHTLKIICFAIDANIVDYEHSQQNAKHIEGGEHQSECTHAGNMLKQMINKDDHTTTS